MSASNQTYTVCCGSPGNGMPHGWRCREIEMSCRPASSRRSTSLRRISGCTVSEPERMRSSTASRYALRRKKWLRSLVGISSSVGCSTQCPATICAPVLNSSHPVQYNPSYSASNRSAGWCCWMRSEEHTSELQSRLHLVCRLLLEKKKKSKHQIQH